MQLSVELVELDRNSYNYGRHSFRNEEFFPEHNHGFYEFFLVLSGTLLHRLNGRDYRLKSGTVQLINPSDTHRLSSAGNPGMVEIFNCNVETGEMLKNLYFISASYQESLQDCIQTASGLPAWQWEGLRGKAERLLELRNTPNYPENLRNSLCRALTQEVILTMLQRNYQTGNPVLPWLESAFQAMQRRENYLAGLPRFLQLAGRSQEHLCRCMRSYYGISPQQYILELRLKDAAAQLEKSRRSVTEIAYDAGFNNLSYFRRCFFQRFGISPLRYRSKISPADR